MFTKKPYRKTVTKDRHPVKIERKRTPKLLFKHRYYIYIYSKETPTAIIAGWEAVDITKAEKELKQWTLADIFKRSGYLRKELKALLDLPESETGAPEPHPVK
jgi:hypothetical protein